MLKVTSMMLSLSLFSLLLGIAHATQDAVLMTAAIPSFTIKNLLTDLPSQQEFSTILQTTGLLSIELPTLSSDRHTALTGLCGCDDFLSLKGTDTALLDDSTTVRQTLATATVGTTPLALPHALSTACGSEAAHAMDALRDHAAAASRAFVRALDQTLDSRRSATLIKDAHGASYPTVSSLISTANHLEHFHVYSQKETASENNSKQSLEWHTDAGLFLAFVPAINCYGGGIDEAFYFKNERDRTTRAIFSPSSVVFMLGAGAEHWLQTAPTKLKATRHAVQMESGSERAWYGMMHLVPESAIIQTAPDRTFGDMKKNMVLSGKKRREYGHEDTQEVVSIGCGPAVHKHTTLDDTIKIDITPSRRRVQHVADASACNNATNFFCWVRCLDIPNYEQVPSYVNEGYSLYCLDPGILARSGNVVSKAVEPCADFVHNSNCMGVWQPTAPGTPGQVVSFNATTGDDNPPFCYGGTSMYMDGFTWIHETTCVIYLFPEWILSTRGKFAAAAIGTFFFGILLEMVISQRRKVVSKFQAGYGRLAASALFYGLQLTMGYFLMLVVMTYSGPLFMCTIFGIMSGHVLFNAKDAIFVDKKDLSKKNKMRVPVDTPCCEEANGDIMTTAEEGCCSSSGSDANKESNIEDGDDDNEGVPEGSTPCCQHTL